MICQIKEAVKKASVDVETALVGVSGGADSVCLLHALAASGLKVVAIHLNHGWRGAESDADEAFVRDLCAILGVEFYSEKLDEDCAKTETAARQERYEFFERALEKFNADVLFLAHNKNDNVETLVYRLIKGTGIDGLCAIPTVRGKFHRPLLEVSREEIETYARENSLPTALDSSNDDIKYARNYIRKEILPKMFELNPHVLDAVENLIKIANNQNEITKAALNNIITPEGIETKEFLKASNALQMSALHEFLKDDLKNLSYKKIVEIREFVLENSKNSLSKKYSLSSEFFLSIDEREISKIPSNETKIELELPLGSVGEYVFEPLNLKLIVEKADKAPKNFPKETENSIRANLPSLDGLVLRTRREGDIFRPFGMSGKMKLKEFLINKKIPRQKRDSLLLLTKGSEVLWICAHAMSEKLRVTDFDKNLYLLRIEDI